VLLLVSVLPAQQTPAPQKPEDAANAANAADLQATPTFKARTDLVLVPVVVRDNHGQHLAGLSKDAFRLEENGKPQDISLFDEVHAGTNDTPPPAHLDRGFSNLPFDDTHELRLTIMVLDLLNTTPVQRDDSKDLFIKFLSKGLAHNQPVSLLCLTSKNLLLVHPFTTDTGALIEALKKLNLGAPRIMPRRNASEKTLAQLTEIAQGYIGIPGRKTMIFAAGSIPEPYLERAAHPTELWEADAFEQTFKSLIDANIAIYPFEPMAWSHDPASRNRRDVYRENSNDQSLREIADATGGNRCVESNDLMKCFAEAVEDSRSYYMLGFSVQPEDRKPGWRNLSVKTSVGHANVRTRNGFYYGNPTPASPTSARDAEVNALASSLAYSALPMYVRVLPPAAASANATPAPGQKTTVEFLVTIPLSSITVNPASSSPLDLEIGGIALTRDTQEAGEFLHPVRGNPKPEALRQFARDGIKLREKLELPPGFYDVRIMVRDNNTTQIGTVVFPLEVK
jgi:VWFA-related protein